MKIRRIYVLEGGASFSEIEEISPEFEPVADELLEVGNRWDDENQCKWVIVAVDRATDNPGMAVYATITLKPL